MLKKTKIISMLLCCSLLLISCGKGDSGNGTTTGDEEEKAPVELNISAAASLKEVMTDLETEYKKSNENVILVVNYGSSGSLQQQIEQGAPCDLFISAGQSQINNLKEKGLLLDDTTKDLVENSLVLVAANGVEISSLDDLKSDNVTHIAVGEPESVPAGKYADEVLTNTGIKDSINDKLVFAKDVKEVLAWVASGNADVGFVYLSDALSSDRVSIVENVDEVNNNSSITYPVSVIKDSTNVDEAKKFEDFLFTDTAQKIFEKYGYKSVK
ncbi:molybdate ABC transporter substrate-binding protein [Clostridium sp.]|uniref:molybdate ABC transporter substrate-binding protein n=1 Tax=Clostridium sp. TaxID=1506 RepID=UPI00260A3CEE|nr:molybdate ABC transporter substrate-binding protein [Clostridium sp.]